MTQLERLIDTAFLVYEGAVAGHETVWLDEEDVEAVARVTGQGLRSVVTIHSHSSLPEPVELPVMDRSTSFNAEGERVAAGTHYEILLDDQCLRVVSDALKKKWRQKVGPRYPGAVFPTLARLRTRFANRTAVEAIGDLNAIKQRWLRPLAAAATAPERPANPTYGLVYDKTTHAVLAVWPDDKRRRPRTLPLPLGSQGYRVFTAMRKQRRTGFVTDVDLAGQLYKQGYSLSDPKVKGNIRRWVCHFNKVCQSVTGEPGRPLIRRKGQYEIMVKVGVG